MICNQCRKKNPKDSEYCMHCGNVLIQKNSKKNSEIKRDITENKNLILKKNKLNKVVILILTTLLVLAAVFDTVSIFNQKVALPFVICSLVCLIVFFVTVITGKIIKKNITKKSKVWKSFPGKLLKVNKKYTNLQCILFLLWFDGL